MSVRSCLTAVMVAAMMVSGTTSAATAQEQIPDRGTVRPLEPGVVIIRGLELDGEARDGLRQMGAEQAAELDETHYLYDADARSWVRYTAELDSLREARAEAADSLNAALRDSIHTLRYRLDYCKSWQDEAVQTLEDQQDDPFWSTAENILWGAAGYGVGQIACGTQ